ncbi:MAG: site-2 protease family protein [Candidatus Omnitrophica bacterium]|nr:site-2 protease family protein [Candidatus Omnitrophota bacterium]
MGIISLLFHDPAAFLILVIPLLYSVIAHETAHGWAAYLFGDDTAKRSGRLSINPLRHIDPVGTMALVFVGFGWARPVPVDYSKLRPFRLGLICVSSAGIFANILIAAGALYVIKLEPLWMTKTPAVILSVMARINIVLGAFNLIPIPPLDGSKILFGFLPSAAQDKFMRLERYGFPLLLVLLITGAIEPLIKVIENVILHMLLVR